MMATIDNHGVVEAPTHEDVSLWAASAHWDMDGKPMMRKAWLRNGYSWFVEEDEPPVDPMQVCDKEGKGDEEVDAIDRYDDYDFEEEVMNIMMEEEGMTDDVRAMMTDMEKGIAMDDDNGETEEDHYMWNMTIN